MCEDQIFLATFTSLLSIYQIFDTMCFQSQPCSVVLLSLTRSPSEDQIDKATLEVKPADDGQVYSSLADLVDSLPDNAPRFILLSYPITVVGPT